MPSTSTSVEPTPNVTRRMRVVPSSEFRVPSSARAFTLVEMLVVIAIIGILAALITPAVYQALWSARQSKIKTELDQLASAIEAFKAKYGSYPPANLAINAAMNNNAALVAFVAKAFPRYTIANLNRDLLASGTNQAGVDVVNFNPQRALVFWLSGQSPDITDPFNFNNVVITRTPFFDFDKTRLIDVSTNSVAIPGTALIGRLIYNAPSGSAAYAYLDYQSYGVAATPVAPATSLYTAVSGTVGPVYMYSMSATTTSLLSGVSTPMILSNGAGYLAPYFSDLNNNGVIDSGEQFVKPQSFQIISAGQDGVFGTATAAKAANFRLFPTGVGYDSVGADDDNVSNFNEKNSLDSAKP